jgi:hypothetical protein
VEHSTCGGALEFAHQLVKCSYKTNVLVKQQELAKIEKKVIINRIESVTMCNYSKELPP